VPLTARLRGLPKPPGQSGETGLTRANQTPAAEQAPSGGPGRQRRAIRFTDRGSVGHLPGTGAESHGWHGGEFQPPEYAVEVSMRAPGRDPATTRRARGRTARPSFEVVESKLRPPALRPGIVTRTVLLDRLDGARTSPVISVVAPPGYGKSTLLSQWAGRMQPRVGWISLDHRDNDPAVLLTHIVMAVDRIEPLDPTLFRALTSAGASVTVPRGLVSAIAAMSRPPTLVLDHLEAVTSRECLDAIAQIAVDLPPGAQLAIGSRERLPLPEARLRAQGGLVEIGLDDLAMDEAEASSLLGAAGIRLSEARVSDLVGRTEGWPVGLYLAALALLAGARHTDVAVPFTGDDRFIADYLRAEFLDRVSPAEATFLTRTSILDSMCGPLCDAVLRVTRSSSVLENLESRNLLVIPLDRRRDWYRYHHLFRELLSRELRRREPEIVGELQFQAAEWYEANGMPEAAIDHAQAAGDADRVARLVLEIANRVWASGRADTVLQWMEWFEAGGLVEHYPGIAAHGALIYALKGRPGATERWAAAAERAPEGGTLADGNTVDATISYMRAVLCRDGIEEMRRDAQLALQGLSPASPYRATMLHAEGLSHLLGGDLERADALFSRAVDAAVAAGVTPFVPVLLAERGIVAIDREEWRAAEAIAQQAMSIMSGGDFDDYWTSALVYAWEARVASHRGNVAEGRDHIVRAARLRPLLTYALPVVSAQALLEIARAYTALADPSGARAVLRQLQDVVQQRPHLGRLPGLANELRARLDTFTVRAVGASSLTTAELRVLTLLPTHLTFREIGERLYVSRHTVKSQVMSVYRKLGVSSRSEAIDRVEELGLLTRA
jgi:LuxR family transcriptional regulator, maltose regulon positive regulatory protein